MEHPQGTTGTEEQFALATEIAKAAVYHSTVADHQHAGAPAPGKLRQPVMFCGALIITQGADWHAAALRANACSP